MKWFRDNGLTLALLGLFAVSLIGQGWSGWLSHVAEQTRHGEAGPTLFDYLASGQFLSALFENWESEFLQMWAFVMLTAYLVQKGSPESKKPDEENPQDRDPALDENKKDAPWPVRAGGLARVVYSHSLGFALLLLFIASFVLHWINSTRHAADEARAHGESGPTLLQQLADAEFWFESFQNWQSEFLSTAVLIVLGIYLRERHSPESKPVSAPHPETGSN
ncbi:MAG: DUF6766 family protein [Hyphomonadaceae bacterium]